MILGKDSPTPQAKHLLLCFAGLRLLSDHALQSHSQDRHSFLRLAHRALPPAEVSSGGVCEREPARRGALPGRGDPPTTSITPRVFQVLPSQEESEPGHLDSTPREGQRNGYPGRHIWKGNKRTLAFSTQHLLPRSGTISVSLKSLWGPNCNDSKIREYGFTRRIWLPELLQPAGFQSALGSWPGDLP